MSDTPETRITVNDNGSIKVEGDFVILDGAGNTLPPGEPGKVWLCRCGGSGNKPYCDGSHKRNGFQSRPRPAGQP
ncbi:MAG: CDGSH iron-sulfur domain-containing protein [Dehalococcoidia bacterium]